MTICNIPRIKIGNLEVNFIQGGMGVGVSQAGLASAVANSGGLGVIASVGLGALNKPEGSDKTYFLEELGRRIKKIDTIISDAEKKAEMDRCYALANQIALRDEIKKTRKKTNGLVGTNIMHALTDYSSLVEAAISENVDVIISGAGVPRDLPKYLKNNPGKKTKLIPIVSDARLAEMICKSWTRNYEYAPDAIIVEGPMAGGHLGYSLSQLENPEFVTKGLANIVKEVNIIVQPYRTISKTIPIIAAGGIFYGGDILSALSWGASGVQMATRFVTTHECDASSAFKQAFIDCKKEDLRIIKSPVGMPGRAITGEFLERVIQGETTPINCPYHCLKPCIPEKSPYCIGKALTNAYRGIISQGFVFAGSNAWRCSEIMSVHDLVEKLDYEAGKGIICQ
ncbi:MAG: nitronate monooxygenase family protein [archaeon]